MKTTLPTYQDQKSGIITLRSEQGNIHQSYVTEEGHIVVFEFIPENHPSSTMGVFENLDKYIESIQNIDWINNVSYVLSISEQLEEAGYPFMSNEDMR